MAGLFCSALLCCIVFFCWCLTCGVLVVFRWMRLYDVPFYYLAEGFLLFCILQVVMLPMGIFAGRTKSQKVMAVYIFIATIVACGLGALGGICIFVAGLILLPQNYSINE